MRIIEFELTYPDKLTVMLPEGARIYNARLKNYVRAPYNRLLVCAGIDESRPPIERRFAFVKTGDELPAPRMEYLASFSKGGGDFLSENADGSIHLFVDLDEYPPRAEPGLLADGAIQPRALRAGDADE